MRFKKICFALAIVLSVMLTACSTNKGQEDGNPSGVDNPSAESYPMTIKHAFGETIIEKKPERIATIFWGNQDVPLALGVAPVGASKSNYGVQDDSGMLPWTLEGFQALGIDQPVLFNDTDGLDFEAIADTQPDVILAAYSGITQQEYELLSAIAPVIAYPTAAWETLWRDQILMDSAGMGMKQEGIQLVEELDQLIVSKLIDYPQIAGKTAAFFYFMPTDLGKFYIYLPTDPRAAYLLDLGMMFPKSVTELAKNGASFALEVSAETADVLVDIDIIIGYGDEALLKALQADPLMGSIPAIQRGSVVMIEDGTPLAASGTPSALSLPATIDEYLKRIAVAADLVK